MASSPTILCILDGWGVAPASPRNAMSLARLPHYDALCEDFPMALLSPAGEAVGLPEGQMGNSEVGHMTIGAGRVLWQDLPRIHHAIRDGSLAKHRLFRALMTHSKPIHILGLLSDGGVHSHCDHLFFMIEQLLSNKRHVVLHGFLDGRDTPPHSAISYVEELLKRFGKNPHFMIGTLMGRYYAMDRDKRWDRTEKAYRAIALADGTPMTDPVSAIHAAYEAGLSDEFITPYVHPDYQGLTIEDALCFMNFRADRMRQIASCLLMPEWEWFPRPDFTPCPLAISLTHYSDSLSGYLQPLFAPPVISHTLGEIIASHGLRQLRLAETEKYAHVTFFFNGGNERPYPGETRILVPSAPVATYDLHPEMSAKEITDHAVEAIQSDEYHLIVINYANADMVGHSGNLTATIRAVETLDKALRALVAATKEAKGTLFITADHGNAEAMTAHDGSAHTAHTTNPVPFIAVNYKPGLSITGLDNGGLADIAPTILTAMNIPIPESMTGHSLLHRKEL